MVVARVTISRLAIVLFLKSAKVRRKTLLSAVSHHAKVWELGITIRNKPDTVCDIFELGTLSRSHRTVVKTGSVTILVAVKLGSASLTFFTAIIRKKT